MKSGDVRERLEDLGIADLVTVIEQERDTHVITKKNGTSSVGFRVVYIRCVGGDSLDYGAVRKPDHYTLEEQLTARYWSIYAGEIK